MLILSRKLNESIVIDGRITVKVMRIDGEVIKLGIAAPAEVPVHRQEVYEEIRKSNQEAVTRRTGSVPKLSTHGGSAHVPSHSASWQDRQLQPDTEVKEPKQSKPNQV